MGSGDERRRLVVLELVEVDVDVRLITSWPRNASRNG
jgi:hypothetical protein